MKIKFIALAPHILEILFVLAALSAGAESPAEVSLSLDQAVAQGVKANLDLLAAQLNIPQAEADAVTAGLYSNPAVVIDTVFQPFSAGNWNQTNAGGPKQYDLVFSYPFDFSGKRSSAEKSAKENIKVTEATFRDTVRQKIRDIRLAYFDWLVAQQQVILAHEKEDRLRHLVEVLERRIGQKQLQPLLLVRAQLARDQSKLDAEQREISLRTAKTNLAVLLAFPEEKQFVPGTKLRDFKLLDIPDKSALIKHAMEKRPDYQALQSTAKKAEYDRHLAEAQVWDNFQVTAGITSQGPTSGSPDGSLPAISQANSWNLGVTIPLPTFNRNQGNVTKAGLIETQLEKQKQSLELSISQEISTLRDQLLAGKHLLEAYESSQLKQAREVRDAQARLFGTGTTALLDYFDGINAYISAYSSYYEAVGDYRRNMARLNSALGKDEL
jgi:cobalt-zinc-cadmium efflux system outer membrane protein